MFLFSSESVLAIIPVYDELGKIGRVISRFSERFVDEICVVVDSPTNAILDEIKSASEKISIPVHVIKNPERRGIGYAIKEGFQYALERSFDVIVVMAGNNKDDPVEIPRFLRAIFDEGYDYVQGSRFLPGGRYDKLPFFRGLFVRFYPFLWTLFTGFRCTDVTNGFRAYKTEILKDKRVYIWQDWLDDYSLEYYLHYKVLKLGYKVKEVPVSKTYPYRHKGGYSKIRPFKDFWSIIGPFIYLLLGVKK